MKTIIIVGALAISTGAFAQGVTPAVKAEKGKAQTEIREQSGKVEQNVKEKVDKSKQQESKIDRKVDGTEVKDQAKEKTNNGKAYGKEKQDMAGKEFGQSRAAEAKLKAKEVKTKSDAESMIRMSKEDTKETMGSIDTKMVTARTKLNEKLASGEITQAQFNEKMKTLMEFEKRKNEIVNEMK